MILEAHTKLPEILQMLVKWYESIKMVRNGAAGWVGRGGGAISSYCLIGEILLINKKKGSLPKRDQIEKHWVRGAGSIGPRGNPSCSLFSRQGLVYWL